MTDDSEYEQSDERIVVIGNRPMKDYFWVMALQFQWHRELILHFMGYNTGTVTRLVDLFGQFGVEEVKGTRKEVLVKGKNGKTLKITECMIRKQGRLFP